MVFEGEKPDCTRGTLMPQDVDGNWYIPTSKLSVDQYAILRAYQAINQWTRSKALRQATRLLMINEHYIGISEPSVRGSMIILQPKWYLDQVLHDWYWNIVMSGKRDVSDLTRDIIESLQYTLPEKQWRAVEGLALTLIP